MYTLGSEDSSGISNSLGTILRVSNSYKDVGSFSHSRLAFEMSLRTFSSEEILKLLEDIEALDDDYVRAMAVLQMLSALYIVDNDCLDRTLVPRLSSMYPLPISGAIGQREFIIVTYANVRDDQTAERAIADIKSMEDPFVCPGPPHLVKDKSGNKIISVDHVLSSAYRKVVEATPKVSELLGLLGSLRCLR